MSYLVMARKWRPKNFEEMVGQEHIAQTLRNAIASGRISHAYLFTGTRGVGKTTSARILAKALNCKNGPTATPCEVCENCIAVSQGSSMDVLEIDGASNNSVDNIRDLREQVKYAPMQGQYKVYIIDEVHMLSKAAFNALLKTLEEPPPHVVFIFATTESGKVPHTILSRVQRFDFKRISEAGIRERLEFICSKEGITPEREALEAIARKADGSMRDALSLFDRVYAFAGDSLTLDLARKALGIPEERLFDDMLRHVSGHNAGGAFATLDEVYGQGLEVSEFLTGFGEYLRDMLFSRQQGVTPALLGLGESRFKEIRALGGDLQDGDILRFAKIISDLIAGLKSSPHPRLAVELGLARLAALDRVVTLSQLMGQDVPTPASLPAPASPFSAASSAPSSAPSSDSEEKKKSPELKTGVAELPAPAPVRSPEPVAVAVSTASAVSAVSVLQAAEVPRAQVFAPAPAAAPPWDDAPSSAPPWDDETPPESAPRPFEDVSSDADLSDASALGPSALDPDAFAGEIPEEAPEDEAPEDRSLEVTLPALEEKPSVTALTLDSVPARWAEVVEDYAQGKPFTSGPLRHSRLTLRPGDTTTLNVEFSGPHQYDLFLADADNRKSLRAFLADRLGEDTAFALTFSVDADAPVGEGPSIHPPESAEALMTREPILKTLVDLFEGRVLN